MNSLSSFARRTLFDKITLHNFFPLETNATTAELELSEGSAARAVLLFNSDLLLCVAQFSCAFRADRPKYCSRINAEVLLKLLFEVYSDCA